MQQFNPQSVRKHLQANKSTWLHERTMFPAADYREQPSLDCRKGDRVPRSHGLPFD